jgi:beta-glucanase (GH16 family)
VYAWDSPPGQSFTHTENVALSLTIGSSSSSGSDPGSTGGSPPKDNNGTPDPGASYVPSGYTLVFSDEFSGSSLDTQKWNTLGPWGVQFFTDSKQKQAFVPEAVSVHDGVVSFTADHANGASSANGQPYKSGSITTNGTFTHGYFEARVKLPQGKGFWPAYWVTSSTRWPPEWDIFEIIDNVIYGYPHPIDSGKCQFVEGAAGGDSTYQINNLYGIYHVYGFKWTATDIYWYVDGTLTEHYAIDSAAGANDTYWLNLSFQIGGDWPGDPDGSTPFPAHMDVDYMRVYQQK